MKVSTGSPSSCYRELNLARSKITFLHLTKCDLNLSFTISYFFSSTAECLKDLRMSSASGPMVYMRVLTCTSPVFSERPATDLKRSNRRNHLGATKVERFGWDHLVRGRHSNEVSYTGFRDFLILLLQRFLTFNDDTEACTTATAATM